MPEIEPVEQWWYLSFAEDSGFLGAVVVGPADDVMTAVRLAHAKGCNPGGQVLAATIPQGKEPPEEFRHVLMDLDMLGRMDMAVTGYDAPNLARPDGTPIGGIDA